MKNICLTASLVLISLVHGLHAQELFTYTEPASNMAKGTIGFRLNTTMMNDKIESRNNLHFLPEVMLGLSKKWMLHLEGFLSDRNKNIKAEGGSVYLKYRFYSIDEVHSHFRMAAYGSMAFNNSDIHQDAIDMKGHNSGYELGIVATKLQHKVAVSASMALAHAWDNSNSLNYRFGKEHRNAMNYTLSIGKLLLPKAYKNYKQTNINGMLEMLCQTNLTTGKTYADLAPVMQFIFLSKMRADISYRFSLSNDLSRSAPQGFLLRLEYNIFNTF